MGASRLRCSRDRPSQCRSVSVAGLRTAIPPPSAVPPWFGKAPLGPPLPPVAEFPAIETSEMVRAPSRASMPPPAALPPTPAPPDPNGPAPPLPPMTVLLFSVEPVTDSDWPLSSTSAPRASPPTPPCCWVVGAPSPPVAELPDRSDPAMLTAPAPGSITTPALAWPPAAPLEVVSALPPIPPTAMSDDTVAFWRVRLPATSMPATAGPPLPGVPLSVAPPLPPVARLPVTATSESVRAPASKIPPTAGPPAAPGPPKLPLAPVVPRASPPEMVRSEIFTVAVGDVILSTPSPVPVCSIDVAASPAPAIVVSSEISSAPPAEPAPPSTYVPVPRSIVEPAF